MRNPPGIYTIFEKENSYVTRNRSKMQRCIDFWIVSKNRLCVTRCLMRLRFL